MSKIFIFGIGGTGSRVLRSLTMLLSAGVKINADEIVPVIIDPDGANADLTRTVTLLNKYNAIRREIKFTEGNDTGFFRPEIKRILNNYTLQILSTNDQSFRDFIDYSTLSKSDQALVRMLYSNKNLTSSMEVGFKGNPNIGSVVLNQIAGSNDLAAIANQFNEGDKIFIISSIFGGTGASGFPLLLKTLRSPQNNLPNFNIINKAAIGAVTILPYFKLSQNSQSEIDSSTFISKTKSALAYYEKNISGNNQIDALYYLADDIANTYANNEGGVKQQNDAHMIEFLAATAIIDFANTNYQYGSGTRHMEIGLQNVVDEVTFSSFYRKLHQMLYSPLVQFTLMSRALTDNIDYYASGNFNANKKYFSDFYSGNFFNDLEDYLKKYLDWLKELRNNKRALSLFDLSCTDHPFNVVNGVKPKKIASMLSDYNLFSDRLNSAVDKCKSNKQEEKFLEMFHLGTKRLVKEKLSY